MRAKPKLVYGVGINDADYVVQSIKNGKKTECPFYRTWKSLLRRCYCDRYKEKRPTYIGCYVCDEWLVFSNFKSWMEKQDWKGNQLDKDIINPGNKRYSSENCAFVNHLTNSFILDSSSSRGAYPVGVTFDKRDKKYKAACRSFITSKQINLGYFDNPEDAHQAWKHKKHELAKSLAVLQPDPRVKKALSTRYLADC
jgi:hypothetical protein